MNTTIKTGLAAILLLAISCKKENNTIQSSHVADNTSTQISISDPSVQAYVKIGTQKWMAKNLNVSRYRNGDKIPQVRSTAEWKALATGAWCWYNNDSANGAVYGRLYNWYAVNDPRGLAPTGWHVPSGAEWDTLSTYLGKNAGGKLKDTGTIEAGTSLWYAPNAGATNKTGFTGLPGGLRASGGVFSNLSFYGNWWSSTEYTTNTAWNRYLQYNNGLISRSFYSKKVGFSVRCLRD